MSENSKPVLRSWTCSAVRDAILSFLSDVTDPLSEHFVPEPDRIAVFDNDGTLWVEKPLLAELIFFRDRSTSGHKKTDHHQHMSPMARALEQGETRMADLFDEASDLIRKMMHGVTTEEFETTVLDWLDHARHPRFQVPYTQLAYQPMLEVLTLFQAHRFQCYIVTGSSGDFVRPWSESIYNIAKPNIVGSSLRTRLIEKNHQLRLEYVPVPFNLADGNAKVEAIDRRIGKQPIAAFGNSHGDTEMLRWTGQAPRSLCALVHHTDSVREYEYSPDPHWHTGQGTLALAEQLQWQVIDMKAHWRRMFAHGKSD